MTFWDNEEANLIKKAPEERRLYQSEAISAFGSTDGGPSAPSVASRLKSDTPPAPGSPTSTASVHQLSIPRLPVPDLEDTLRLYLKSLEGLITAEDYERSESLVEEFLAEGSDGRRLQRLLLDHEATAPECGPSWFEEFWDDAYLCARDSIPININYFFGFADHPKHATHGSQIGRAAAMVRSAATLAINIRNRTLPEDHERGQPLCMSQYRRVFCASRIPAPGRDYIMSYSTAKLLPDEKVSKTAHYDQTADPRHIVVLARNRFFRMDVIQPDGQSPVPVAELVRQMATIVRTVTKEGAKAGPPVGLFTTMNRDEWASVRSSLVQLGNEATLKAIQSALLVVCLDGVRCEDLDEHARLVLHGSGTNRWFDRHCLIVAQDGRAGINFEHSVGDGAVTLRIADTMYRFDASAGPSIAEVEKLSTESTKESFDVTARELVWKLDGMMDTRMKRAYEDFRTLIQSNETSTLTFRHFGGDAIKRSGLSPDAFVQLGFQLTYYRLFGRCDATYEAASTRGFLHGRTEVVRSVTRASTDFCEAANQPIFNRRVNSAVPSQADLLRRAATAHVEYMKLAKQAKGVDRHLYGLRRMCALHDIDPPPLFTDANFARSSHWALSTSHCGSSALDLFGFGPVVTDGFGLGYMIKSDSISCCVTSKYTHRLMSSTVFSSILESSLLQMKAILDCDWSKRQAQRPRSLDFVHPTAYADFEYNGAAGFSYSSGASMYQRKSLYTSFRKNTVSMESSGTESKTTS